MIYISLGSNIGDPKSNLELACGYLLDFANIKSKSEAVVTKALLPEGAPESWDMPFMNQVVGLTTRLDPHSLLSALKSIEVKMGRTSKAFWAPRIIDLDILWFNGLAITSPTLTIPHKEIIHRQFIIDLMHSLAPDVTAQIIAHQKANLDI